MRDLATVYGIAFAIVIAIYVEVWRYDEKIERTATREAWNKGVLSLTEFRQRHR